MTLSIRQEYRAIHRIKEVFVMKTKKWERIRRVGKQIYGAAFSAACIGQECESCSNNDSNTPGSFCAGENCGWCHDCKTIWVDGVPCGQDYSTH